MAAVKADMAGRDDGQDDSEHALAPLLASSDWVPVPIVFCRPDGRLLWVNKAWQARWALPSGGASGSLRDYVVADGVQRVLAPPMARTAVTECMVSVHGPDRVGRAVRVRVTHNEVGRLREPLVCLTVVSAPDDSLQLTMLEFGSRLLGEIAHDLNNELSVLLNYSFVLSRQLAGTETELLTELQNAAWRASGVSQGLVKVGRYFDRRDTALAVYAVVEPIAPVLRMLLAGRRALALELEGTTRTCIVPRSRIEQLLMRCVLSTSERVPIEIGGSSLLIRVRTCTKGECSFQTLTVGPVPGVVLQRDAELSSHHESVIMRNIRDAVERCHGSMVCFEPQHGGGVMIELSFPEL